jgi:hypothetical protein
MSFTLGKPIPKKEECEVAITETYWYFEKDNEMKSIDVSFKYRVPINCDSILSRYTESYKQINI